MSGEIISKVTIPTTHKSERGVAEGIVEVLQGIILDSGVSDAEIELISHSTTQAINAFLESDTYKVGIVAMGVEDARRDVTRRTKLDRRGGAGLDVSHEFLDTSHLITAEEVGDALGRLRAGGAEVIVATEAFGVDDPSNEIFVMKRASEMDIPSTASHEISGVYGLEIRTLTAAVNASVLPKTFQVAEFIEDAIRETGITSPLMVMRGDGGITSMETFRTRPILTILSGPAASVTGAMLHLRISNGIFVEVGGTSTNICIIRDGRPEIRYVTIRDHPTCVRSMDVRVLGVAGGSMVAIQKNTVERVGPRSAHIAGFKYACYADPDELEGGSVVLIRPTPGDLEEYAAIRCAGATYAITNTCAANALDMIPEGDYSRGNQESARIALKKLGEFLGVSFAVAATSILQTSSFEITKTISGIIKEFKMDSGKARIIGGGGGASVLVPFAAKQLGIQYSRADNAEVISSIGVAASMIQEELEIATTESTPEQLSQARRKIHSMMISRGAVSESITIESRYIEEKSLLRVTATGSMELDSGDGPRYALSVKECTERAVEMTGSDPDSVSIAFESDNYLIFESVSTERRLLGRKPRRGAIVMDKYGRLKFAVRKGKILLRGKASIDSQLGDLLNSRRSEIAPQVYLVSDLSVTDFSSLTSPSDVMKAVTTELACGGRAAIIVEE